MKTQNIIQRSVLAMAVALATTSAFASEMFNIQPSAVYQVIKGKPLSEALAQVAQRTGIVFKINTHIKGNVITQTIAADDWNTAIKSMLVGYNYSMIQDGKTIKSVIISGYNGDAPVVVAKVEAAPIAAKDLVVIAPTFKDVPAKYKNYPAGSVIPVDLPLDTIMSLQDGATANFDLPIGQYTATHDSTASDATGNKTWVGHLTDEGVGYRMVVSQGAAGVMGHMVTPEGTFNLESEGNGTYLVDTRALTDTGYEGDTIIPAESVMNAAVLQNAATAPTLTQLQAAVTAAQTAVSNATAALATAKAKVTPATSAVAAATKVYNDAVALAKAATDSYNQYLAAYKTANTAFTTATNAKASALAAYNNAVAAYNKTPTAANKTALATQNNNYTAAQKSYTTVFNSLQAAINSVNAAVATANTRTAAATAAKNALNVASQALNAANTAVTIATTNLTAAQSALTAAQKALSGAQTSSTIPAASTSSASIIPATAQPISTGTDSVVDIMVEYTTKGMTAAYAQQRIQYLVTASNQAYKDSGMAINLRLVYAEPTTYDEVVSNNQALTDLVSDKGAFSGVAAKRAQYGADLVYLFRPLYAQTHGSCGTTFLESANGSRANKSIGYGTISDGVSKDAANSSYCQINTFTHEIGHSFGLVHDREYSNVQGAFSYSYAWGIAGKFGTIMSYKSPVVMLFSTPKLATQCAGTPCGFEESNATQSSDQVKSANLTIPQIANFMPTMVTTATIK